MIRASLLGVVLTIGASAAPTSLFFFGDSLSDTGNVYAATSLLSSITFGLVPVEPPSPPYFGGRFSNGPVWTEQVATRAGVPDNAAPAGMSLGFLGELGGTGQNYAIGGARTGFGGALGPLDPFIPTGVLAQVDYYLSMNTADPDALYVLLGGGNDLRDIAALTDPAAQVEAALNAASFMAYSIQYLYSSSARHFMLLNAPNIGFIPESFAAGRVESGTVASVYFNYFLNAYSMYLVQLPGLDLAMFDVFSLYNDLIADTAQGGTQYGFTSLTPCEDGAVSCDVSLFFDDIHPTARVHQLLGDRVADQILGQPALVSFSLGTLQAAAVPEPGTGVVMLGAFAILWARRATTLWTR